jgi:anti-anti-sigma factor
MIRCIELAPGEFTLRGRVDVTSVADLRTYLQKAVDAAAPLAAVPGATVRVDVAGLELVDAAGLGALVSAHRRAGRAGLGFALVNVPDPLSRLLFISRLYRVLTVEDGESGARRESVVPAARQSGSEGSKPIHA